MLKDYGLGIWFYDFMVRFREKIDYIQRNGQIVYFLGKLNFFYLIKF